ncbi:hypothetical protein PROFUN_10527 [Planoprotostelium fungivorum]|uniref:Uncharacterized protein n=1 Tax=Planoprotostelium fungivorum TaxID=1890364 RepID=A0A2P6NDE9_9EUKA|nr:hypothetical protein PROFUN_10527 [Planoprotostelium fungivorum]
MKRQRIDVPPLPIEEAALNVVLTSEKATVIAVFSKTDWPFTSEPSIPVVNDAARDIMQPLLETEKKSPVCLSFWNSVSRVGRGENITREDLRLPHSYLRIKYRRVEDDNDISVIITAKRVRDIHDLVSPLQSMEENFVGPRDLQSLIAAVEQDVIQNILGLKDVILGVMQIDQQDRIHLLGSNLNSCQLFQLNSPQQLKGKIVNREESLPFSDLINKHIDPHAEVSKFQHRIPSFPGTFYFCVRRVLPDTYLVLSMRDLHSDSRVPLIMNPSPSKRIWTRAKWDTFVENCIRHIKKNPHYGSTTRQTLPKNIYCYAYTGPSFLPSGNSDGYLWKSSRGAMCSGSLKRTYFYTEDMEGKKLRRRVMWLEDVRGVQMVEYRHFEHHGNMDSVHLLGPSMMDWPSLFDIPLQDKSPIDVITREKRGEGNRSGMPSYVNNIMMSWELQFGQFGLQEEDEYMRLKYLGCPRH